MEPRFIANVGDNFWHRGLYVCPDIDIITYTLSGVLDTSRGWGVAGDTFVGKESLSKISETPEWFSLGDRDRVLCERRTELISKGWGLSAITNELCSRLGVSTQVIPATDDPVQMFVRTAEGNLHLQEFWVKNTGKLQALGVMYVGIENARPTSGCLEACQDPVIICPANPVSSILPALKLRGVRSRLSKSRVIAISPFVGEKPFSGPAANLMKALDVEASSRGVAKLYSGFLKVMFLDRNEDPNMVTSVRDLGIECIVTNTKIESESDKMAITKELISAL